MDEYQQGIDAFKSGDYAGAITILSSYLNDYPENADAWNVKGSALARLGKYQAAIYCYDKALEMQPGNEKYSRNRGIIAKKILVKPVSEESYPVNPPSAVRAPKPHVQGLKTISKAILVIIVFCIIASAIASFVFGMADQQTWDDKKFIEIYRACEPGLNEALGNYLFAESDFELSVASQELMIISGDYDNLLKKLHISKKYEKAYNDYEAALFYANVLGDDINKALKYGDTSLDSRFMVNADDDYEKIKSYRRSAGAEISRLIN